MKKILGLTLVMIFVAGLVYAAPDKVVETSGRSIDNYEPLHHTHQVALPNIDDKEDVELSVKLDAPDLVKINKDVSVGVEIEKDCVQTNMKEGWKAVAKVTVKWSLLDFSK